MLAMMKAIGRSIDVLVTTTVGTKARRRSPAETHFISCCLVPHSHTTQSVFQVLMECVAASGIDVKQLNISGRPRLFRVDDSLVQQLKLCVRPEVLKC
jgi:hypothetical protein